jgi:hypothetical protein
MPFQRGAVLTFKATGSHGHEPMPAHELKLTNGDPADVGRCGVHLAPGPKQFMVESSAVVSLPGSGWSGGDPTAGSRFARERPPMQEQRAPDGVFVEHQRKGSAREADRDDVTRLQQDAHCAHQLCRKRCQTRLVRVRFVQSEGAGVLYLLTFASFFVPCLLLVRIGSVFTRPLSLACLVFQSLHFVFLKETQAEKERKWNLAG